MIKGYSEFRTDGIILAYSHGLQIVTLKNNILHIDNNGWFNIHMIKSINYALRDTPYRVSNINDEFVLFNNKNGHVTKFFGNDLIVNYSTGKKFFDRELRVVP